jgi:hypothetical protein
MDRPLAVKFAIFKNYWLVAMRGKCFQINHGFNNFLTFEFQTMEIRYRGKSI